MGAAAFSHLASVLRRVWVRAAPAAPAQEPGPLRRLPAAPPFPLPENGALTTPSAPFALRYGAPGRRPRRPWRPETPPLRLYPLQRQRVGLPTALVLAAPAPEPEGPASAYTVRNFPALLDPLQRGTAGAAANTTVQVSALISQPPWKDSAAGSGALWCSMRAARALRHRRRAGLQLAAAAGSRSALRHETAAQTIHGASQNSPRSRRIEASGASKSRRKSNPIKCEYDVVERSSLRAWAWRLGMHVAVWRHAAAPRHGHGIGRLGRRHAGLLEAVPFGAAEPRGREAVGALRGAGTRRWPKLRAHRNEMLKM